MVTQVIRGSGHHVYADRPDEFNLLVSASCDTIDSNENTLQLSPTLLDIDALSHQLNQRVMPLVHDPRPLLPQCEQEKNTNGTVDMDDIQCEELGNDAVLEPLPQETTTHPPY